MICDTPTCGRPIPAGGGGHPEICPTCLECLRVNATSPTYPVPMLLWCPSCGERHIDSEVWAARAHHTHACQECGMVWRPAVVDTVGVVFLPGFRNTP